MEIKLNFTNTYLAAWWGAILASIVFLWDIYKWKTSGPQIRFSVKPNMKIFDIPIYEGKTFISATAENIGTGATTITGLEFQYYKNWFKKIFKKPDSSWLIIPITIAPEYKLPYVLNPGTIWKGLVLQAKELAEKTRKGYLFCELYYSQNRKPKRCRVIIK